jgi:ABC-type branched-subunit amino acid transport system substrate-binding protein
MISEAAGAGVIRQDVQQAIESEGRDRLGEGDAPGALARWQQERRLLVLQTVKANACLSQLQARAAVKAGATLAQVLQVIQYVELTGMVTWVMVGHDALTAAEAAVPDAQRLWGAVRHTQRCVQDGGTVPELMAAVA